MPINIQFRYLCFYIYIYAVFGVKSYHTLPLKSMTLNLKTMLVSSLPLVVCRSADAYSSDWHGGWLIRMENWLLLGITWGHPRILSEPVFLIFLVFCVVLYIVCLRPVSYMPNIVGASGWSILDCSFGFL